jgi:hypothetical protein
MWEIDSGKEHGEPRYRASSERDRGRNGRGRAGGRVRRAGELWRPAVLPPRDVLGDGAWSRPRLSGPAPTLSHRAHARTREAGSPTPTGTMIGMGPWWWAYVRGGNVRRGASIAAGSRVQFEPREGGMGP